MDNLNDLNFDEGNLSDDEARVIKEHVGEKANVFNTVASTVISTTNIYTVIYITIVFLVLSNVGFEKVLSLVSPAFESPMYVLVVKTILFFVLCWLIITFL